MRVCMIVCNNVSVWFVCYVIVYVINSYVFVYVSHVWLPSFFLFWFGGVKSQLIETAAAATTSNRRMAYVAGQLVPICKHDAKKNLGAWKPVQILSDHIAIEAGFSKRSYQTQCVTLESDGATRMFVHVKKTISMVCSSCGRPTAWGNK